MLQSTNSSAVGFVDNTNILTWSNPSEENCQRFEELHEKCAQWAKNHGVKFAPHKYQLMHLARPRERHNLQAEIRIHDDLISPTDSLRILGVNMDPGLNWNTHIKSIQLKAGQQLQALSRLTHSTWGAKFINARLLYKTLVTGPHV